MPEGLTWYEQAVFKTLRELHQMSRNFIHTRIVAGFLDKNDRIVRGVLVRLEQKQVVYRKGLRGGWKPVDMRLLASSSTRSLTAPPVQAWKPSGLFVAPKLEAWKPPVPHPKPAPSPIILQEYLSSNTLQAVM